MLGYITYDVGDDRDISLALWSADRCCPLLGMELLYFLQNNVPHRHIICTGINPATTEKIYRRMGFATFKMNHWYRLRPADEYVIAKITDRRIIQINVGNDFCWRKLTKELFCGDSSYDKLIQNNAPNKSKGYIIRRYYDHPIYEYHVFELLAEDKKCIFVIRLQDCNDSSAIRFVDFIGDIECFKYVTAAADVLLDKYNAEYIDIYESGVNAEIIKESGGVCVSETDNIIPNYFAPYLRENIDIYCCSTDPGAILFRGDGDQDRPS